MQNLISLHLLASEVPQFLSAPFPLQVPSGLRTVFTLLSHFVSQEYHQTIEPNFFFSRYSTDRNVTDQPPTTRGREAPDLLLFCKFTLESRDLYLRLSQALKQLTLLRFSRLS